MAVAGALSIGLRALLLLGKFAFIIVLASHSDAATVGIYSLIVTIIAISIYVVGLEIHTFTTREIVDQTDLKSAEHVQSHLLTVAGSYLLALPFVLGFAYWLDIASKFSFALFAAVMFCECVAQELGRYLMILSRPIASNLLQFVRGAAWMPIPLFLIMSGHPGPVIDMVLLSWLLGAAAACTLGIWNIRQFFVDRKPYRLSWLRKAFVSARVYLVVSLLTQLQNYSDRFVIQRILGESPVGVYSFYQSFANTMMAFVQTGVVAVLLPKLIMAAKRNDLVGEQRVRRTMFVAALGMAAAISFALAIAMPLLLQRMGKSAYTEELMVFYILLAGNLLLVAGSVVHLSLYARHRDLALMRVALIVIPLALLTNILVVPGFGITGASLTFAAAAALDLVLKYRLLRNDRRAVLNRA